MIGFFTHVLFYRMSAQQILEHALFVIEPEVVLLTTDESSVHLTLQVVFKGVDKRSVKFDFNVVMYHHSFWVWIRLIEQQSIIGNGYT